MITIVRSLKGTMIVKPHNNHQASDDESIQGLNGTSRSSQMSTFIDCTIVSVRHHQNTQNALQSPHRNCTWKWPILTVDRSDQFHHLSFLPNSLIINVNYHHTNQFYEFFWLTFLRTEIKFKVR
uniref:Uncharacterized protein n=1 Tax=Tetranychus urticae TaxID=32264 RepID=T1KG92_TETUR